MAESVYPFTNFNFAIEITVEDVSKNAICEAQFSECDGLEISMEVKTIREGGGNNRMIHLAGPVGYSELSLRRGMTANMDLWQWFNSVVQNPSIRSDASIVMFASEGETIRATFELMRCIPIKLKAPSFNAGDGGLAIEEFTLSYEHLTIKPPETDTQAQEASS